MNDIVRFTNEHKELLKPLKPRSLQIRSSSEGIVISIYSAKENGQVFNQYKVALVSAFPEVKKVLHFAESNKNRCKSYVSDRIFDLDMQFTSEAFRQVNTPTFEKILQIIHDFAAEEPFSCGADLYCGSGIIGLSLAAKFPASDFWGIEINEDAIRDAKKNAERNGIRNIRFFGGDAATFKSRLPRGEKMDLIVVDPPRAGLSKGMRRDLLLLDPDRIVYVSCNPQTMARDLADLCNGGYTMRSVIPVNMFPRTKHTETVVLLSREKANGPNLNFRIAQQHDAEQVLSLYQRAKSGEFCVWNDCYPSMAEIEHDLETRNLYVMTDGHKIIGAISVVPENELDGFDCWSCKDGKEIARVVIDKDYQGHGLSYEMVQRTESILRRNGHMTIHLSVVKSNIPAYKTYIKAGFVTVGEADMYGGSYYLMEKAIDTNSLPK